MAALTQTITNGIGVFGGERTISWGVMVWGVDKWGTGNYDLKVDVSKLISSTVSCGSSRNFDFNYHIPNQASVASTSGVGTAMTFNKAVNLGSIASDSAALTAMTFNKTVDFGSVTVTADMGSEYIYVEAFRKLFGDQESGEDRAFTTYSRYNSGASGYTEVTIPSTTWSVV